MADALRGVRIARNRGLHQIAELVEVRPGGTYDGAYPKVYTHTLAWLSYREFPAGRNDDRSDDVAGYRAAFEGQPVGLTFTFLQIALEHEVTALLPDHS